MNRRKVLKWMAATATSLVSGFHAMARALGGETSQTMPSRSKTLSNVVILHTNDLHGHLTDWHGWEGELRGKRLGGIPCLASAIAQARQQANDSILLLDTGDLIGDTMIADLTMGRALIAAFNQLLYDAMTLGNHEPDFGIAALRERLKEARFPFLAANLIAKQEGEPLAAPYLIKRVGSVSVGLLGLTYPKTPWTTTAKNVAEVEFQDPVPAVKYHLGAMREEGAELIVVLSHLGLGGDKQLAEAVDGIDVIVGGHSHNRMRQAEAVRGTLIVQAGAHGSDLGKLELTVANGKITAHRHELIVLDHAMIAPDQAAQGLVEEWMRPHRNAMDEEIGQAADWLVRAQTIAGQAARKRDAESPVDSLFADILREELKADIAFLPGVGYGVAIPPGPITAAQLRQFLPHDGRLVSMRLTGANVHEVLEQAVENVFTEDPKRKVGGMIQVSGIRFRYDPSRERGRQVTNVEVLGSRWEANREYLVATNSMLAQGGHNQRAFREGKEVTEHGSQYETTKRWIAAHSPVKTAEPARIARERSG